MTDISLKQYLITRTGIGEDKIDALITIDSLDELSHPLSQIDKVSISEALYGLKSLDPACGSGAFPIGLLQKLVFILSQTDPKLEIGKSKLPENYFSEKPHLENNHDYIRKLILIRDVIHGVDIQPIAVEISKLRCFLTLIVEQEVLDDKSNRGIEPLPNLDFRFVAANTLVRLNRLNTNQDTSLWDEGWLEDELDSIRQECYSTTNKKKLLELKIKQDNLFSQELLLFGDSKRASQLATFQPFVANSQASVFDSKIMFGRDVFDLVIGNPPYVKIEHLSESVRDELSGNYLEYKAQKKKVKEKAKAWTDDLYVHFIFRAFEFIGEGGVVCFITNDSFISLDTKVRVRKKLLEENLIELIGCPEETFGATIYTAIFLASRNKMRQPNYKGAKFSYPGFELVETNFISKTFVEQLPNKRFVLQDEYPLITKLLGKKEKISDYLRVMDCGIHSGNVRRKVFSLAQTAEANSRMIQGKQIVRWAVNWDRPKAKYKYCNPNYVPIDEFGIGRGGKKSKRKEYWGFAGDKSNHFLPERILLRQTGDSLYAAYQNTDDDGQLYTDNTLFTVVVRDEGSMMYFLGILNSKVLNYVYHFLSSEEGKTLAQVKTGLVEQLPIVYEKSREAELSALVSELIRTKRDAPESDVSKLENKLDEIVCDIFGLSPDEKEIILSH